MNETKQIKLDSNGDMLPANPFSFEAVSAQMDFINRALYGVNGATELAGDSKKDFVRYTANGPDDQDSEFRSTVADVANEMKDEDAIPY